MITRTISVPGFRIGTAQDRVGLTGVTVILAPEGGATAGVDVRGCAPGTRETDLLSPEKTVQQIHFRASPYLYCAAHKNRKAPHRFETSGGLVSQT